MKKFFKRNKYRKVIAKIYNKKTDKTTQEVCYFRKTFTKTSTNNNGDVYTEILAELETVRGELLYLSPNCIKFID